MLNVASDYQSLLCMYWMKRERETETAHVPSVHAVCFFSINRSLDEAILLLCTMMQNPSILRLPTNKPLVNH